jgi:hypothetical protein
MVSRCEHLLNVVMLNKPKVLRGLAQKWARSWYRRCVLSCRERQCSRRKGMDLTHSGIGTKHGKPISLPQGKPMELWVQERGESEGRPVMGRIGVEPILAT